MKSSQVAVSLGLASLMFLAGYATLFLKEKMWILFIVCVVAFMISSIAAWAE